MADQKTEKPTKKRLLKAREEGRSPSTRHFIAGVQFCVVVALINAKGAGWLNQAAMTFRGELKRAFLAELTVTELLHLGSELLYACFFPMLYAGAALVSVGVGIHLGVTKMQFSVQKLAPDPKRLSPLNKIKQLPRQNLTAAVQSLILLPVFAGVICGASGRGPGTPVPRACRRSWGQAPCSSPIRKPSCAKVRWPSRYRRPHRWSCG